VKSEISGANDDLFPNSSCVAFAGDRCLAFGDLAQVASEVKAAMLRGESESIIILDGRTSEPIELDFRGTIKEMLARIPKMAAGSGRLATAQTKRAPGRPRLGVISREVTLLPGQWEWLDQQPGGASGTLRRLVFAARKSDSNEAEARVAQEAVYRFMTTMAGNLPGFEEALRAFYRKNWELLEEFTRPWPSGIRIHLQRLVSKVVANLDTP